MKTLKIDVIILAYRPGEEIEKLLERRSAQNNSPNTTANTNDTAVIHKVTPAACTKRGKVVPSSVKKLTPSLDSTFAAVPSPEEM